MTYELKQSDLPEPIRIQMEEALEFAKKLKLRMWGAEEIKEDAVSQGLMKLLDLLTRDYDNGREYANLRGNFLRAYTWRCIKTSLLDAKDAARGEIEYSDLIDYINPPTRKQALANEPDLPISKPLEPIKADTPGRADKILKDDFPINKFTIEKADWEARRVVYKAEVNLEKYGVCYPEVEPFDYGFFLRGGIMTALPYVEPKPDMITFPPRPCKSSVRGASISTTWHTIANAEQQYIARETRRRIKAGLSPQQNATIQTEIENPGLRRTEKAAMTEISGNTYKNYLFTARKKIKKIIED